MWIMTEAISFSKSTVDGKCIILHTPATGTCLGISIMVSQSVLLYFTYRGKTLMQPAARRSKIVTIVVRDGMLVFGVVIGGSSASLLRYCNDIVLLPGIMFMSTLYFLFNQVVINVFLP